MNRKKTINFLIKLLIAGLLSWAIYRQVFAHQDARSLWEGLVKRFEFPNAYWLLITIILIPLNVALEALKFKTLIRSFVALSFFQISKSILSGITLAIFTPNRVGEYGGRIIFIPAEHNWKAVIATLVGSLAQLLVIMIAGLIGMITFSKYIVGEEIESLPLIISLSGILIAFMLFCFFNIDLLIPIIKRFPFIHYFKKYFKNLLVLKNYSKKDLTKALGLAFSRYLTYSLQYYFLLKFFGIDLNLFIGMAGILTIFFVQASIPLPPVMGLLARGEIALYIWGIFSDDQVAILATTFTLFVLNIAIPALIGMAFIFRANILKSLGYDIKNENG